MCIQEHIYETTTVVEHLGLNFKYQYFKYYTQAYEWLFLTFLYFIKIYLLTIFIL